MTATQGMARIVLRLGVAVTALYLAGCGGGSTSAGGGSSATPAAVRVTADMSVTWDSPNTTVDHSCLQNLSGYRLYIGLSPGVYSTSIPLTVGDASCSANGQTNSCGAIETCTYTVQGLIGWTGSSWHFAVTATDSDGNESAYSNEASHAIN